MKGFFLGAQVQYLALKLCDCSLCSRAVHKLAETAALVGWHLCVDDLSEASKDIP